MAYLATAFRVHLGCIPYRFSYASSSLICSEKDSTSLWKMIVGGRKTVPQQALFDKKKKKNNNNNNNNNQKVTFFD
jgi:hypothetical protein